MKGNRPPLWHGAPPGVRAHLLGKECQFSPTLAPPLLPAWHVFSWGHSPTACHPLPGHGVPPLHPQPLTLRAPSLPHHQTPPLLPHATLSPPWGPHPRTANLPGGRRGWPPRRGAPCHPASDGTMSPCCLGTADTGQDEPGVVAPNPPWDGGKGVWGLCSVCAAPQTCAEQCSQRQRVRVCTSTWACVHEHVCARGVCMYVHACMCANVRVARVCTPVGTHGVPGALGAAPSPVPWHPWVSAPPQHPCLRPARPPIKSVV